MICNTPLSIVCLITLSISIGASHAAERETNPIAGVSPGQRPAGAPTITEFVKGDGWYGQALHGVDQPYPSSLRFLENQGAWHTPFNRPGMPPPYDLRGWYGH